MTNLLNTDKTPPKKEEPITDEEQIKKAKAPHDLFLVNLMGNHILTFVATLGIASSWAWPMLIVPVVSFSILGSIIYRANKLINKESEFVVEHWKIAKKRSLFFVKMLAVFLCVACAGLYGYFNLGWMKEAVYALIGGVCVLPIMLTTLILIILESDSLHHASKGLVR